MYSVQWAARCRPVRARLLAVLALVAAMVACTYAGRIVELADWTNRGGSLESVRLHRERLLLDASIAALLALGFAAAAFRCATFRRPEGSQPRVESPLNFAAPDTVAWQPIERAAPWSWHHLQQVINELPIAIGYFDVSEACLFANEAARRLFDFPSMDDGHASLRSLLGAAEYDSHRHHWEAVKAGNRVVYETSNPRNGSLHQTTRLVPDFDEYGVVQGFCVQMQDVTDVRDAKEARAEGERHLKSITDNMPALITYVSTERKVTFANATFKLWLGADPAVMVGKPLVEVIGETMYNQRVGYLARGFAGEQLTFEMPVKTQGTERDFKTTYIPDFRSDGSVAGIFVLVTDVTAMRAAERHQHQLARVDTLTQLPNRRQFEEKLAEALARGRRYDRDMAMMLLDIDHFKAINDMHGHAAGDAVLVEFASRLKACVRETDTVARLGGDEFVIVIEGLNDPSEATVVAEKFHARLQAPMSIGGHQFVVTSSVGIALVEKGDDTPATVTAKADEALYSAKRAGRNRYAVSGAAAVVN